MTTTRKPLAPSRPKSARAYTGPIPSEVYEVVSFAWEHGVATSSNMAREYAVHIALAASLGWISSLSLDATQYMRRWNVTAEGVHALQRYNTQKET